jgi:hypothetical protein
MEEREIPSGRRDVPFGRVSPMRNANVDVVTDLLVAEEDSFCKLTVPIPVLDFVAHHVDASGRDVYERRESSWSVVRTVPIQNQLPSHRTMMPRSRLRAVAEIGT